MSQKPKKIVCNTLYTGQSLGNVIQNQFIVGVHFIWRNENRNQFPFFVSRLIHFFRLSSLDTLGQASDSKSVDERQLFFAVYYRYRSIDMSGTSFRFCPVCSSIFWPLHQWTISRLWRKSKYHACDVSLNITPVT